MFMKLGRNEAHLWKKYFFLHNFFNIPWFSPRYANQLNTKYNPDS